MDGKQKIKMRICLRIFDLILFLDTEKGHVIRKNSFYSPLLVGCSVFTLGSVECLGMDVLFLSPVLIDHIPSTPNDTNPAIIRTHLCVLLEASSPNATPRAPINAKDSPNKRARACEREVINNSVSYSTL